MSKIDFCQACNALVFGVKSRVAFEHTCGRSKKEIEEYIKENSAESVNSFLERKMNNLSMIENMPRTITDISHEEFIP